ncbi:hypothetical protein Q4E93_10070 [Flavitalea sp. BT771]|uniref:hypothetical protein n=1 Tax=Flavitalea sp. BT771 TaxID=3063329 RepID=UPI0026E387F8|nr:hypothetical protein [Flavitalea sp. BT771]MDO6430934.1 hypothetical protein [Flavitalea sp. BT771]MDV6219841.1 hypothetical protein [Flavitalea sp. BT771]
MEYLREEELARIEQKTFGTAMLERVRDFFIFSCYTGLAYIDLIALKPHNILTTADGLQWIRTTRKKTDIPVNVPLLLQALTILEKYRIEPGTTPRDTVFPYVSNQ